MSHIALRPAYIARPDWMSAARTWLRQARVAINLPYEINLPHQNVEDLSDRQLRDVGAARRDIARAMDRETGRLGLLDIGWQRNRKG